MIKILLCLCIFIIFINFLALGQEQDIELTLNGVANITIPLYENMIFPVTGKSKGSISVENLSPELIYIDCNVIANSINIKGLAPGQASFVLHRGTVKRVIYVSVKESAGILPEKVAITVTGNPAPGRFLKEAALREVMAHSKFKPLANMNIDEEVPFDGPNFLARGEVKVFTIPIRVESPGYYPVRTSVKVCATNRIIPDSETSVLMISNRPEKIQEDGILFEQEIVKSIRLLFYHQNSPKSYERIFTLKIFNPLNEKVEVKFISGIAGPNKDMFFVGHKSTLRFLQDYSSDSGQIVTIPGRREYILSNFIMKPGDLVSGLLEIHVLGGGKLIVTTQAGESDKKVTQFLSDEFNPFLIHPKGVFNNPNISSEIYYNVPDEDLLIPIGVSPWLLDQETGSPNLGNYGVIYKFNLILYNSQRTSKDINIYFLPVNGVAQGVITIDGILYESELVKPGKKSLLGHIVLASKERKVVKIITTPQGASSYPVKLIFSQN